MSKPKHRQKPRYGRDAPATRNAVSMGFMLSSADDWKTILGGGYRPVMECPEIQACIDVYCDLISTMTIKLMRNTENGDVRVKNELSRKIDINPHPNFVRTTWGETITRTMLTKGNAFVFPSYKNGYIEKLTPVPPSEVRIDAKDHEAHTIVWNGKSYKPDEMINFVRHPDPDRPYIGKGYSARLSDVVSGISQAMATKLSVQKSPAPSIIVKVDGLTEEFASQEGRKKLREQFLDSSESGEPWFIPSEAFEVEKIAPLSLSDLAIKDTLELDKKTAAAIMGVPLHALGLAAYNQKEHEVFVSTRVRPIAEIITQTLTKSLLYSPDYYFTFSVRSLMNYSLSELVAAGTQLIDRNALRRNELRGWIGESPDPEMDELIVLENYIPQDRLGDQKKLNGGDENGNQNQND